jgi:chromosome segregation ATPase
MTTSPSSAAASRSSSNGESFSSLPRWRQLLSMLNWRRDPDYEQRMLHYEQRMLHYEQRKMQHEWRMKQLENEILRVRSESEQIEKETKRLRQENARYRQLRAREKAWRTSVEQFFSQPECSSTPQAPTEPDSKPSSP